MTFFEPYMDEIQELCRTHRVKSLHAFGSTVSGTLKDTSDVDLIVDIDAEDPFQYSDLYFELLFGLEDLFARKVDLLETRAANNPVFLQAINDHKRGLYGT